MNFIATAVCLIKYSICYNFSVQSSVNLYYIIIILIIIIIIIIIMLLRKITNHVSTTTGIKNEERERERE